MFSWQRLAVSLNLETRTLRVVCDDMDYELHLELPTSLLGPDPRLEVRGGGRLVVGQRLYSMQGDFILKENLDGEVADYRIYDVALGQEQMKKLLSCSDLPGLKPPLIDLENGVLKVKGPTETRNISTKELCGNYISGFYLFFSGKMFFKDANSWCKKLKGELILPEDDEVNAYLFDRFLSYKDQCSDIWTHLYWIGADGDLKTSRWLKLADQTPLTFHPFLSLYEAVTTEYQCIASVTHEHYKWAATSCDIEACILCNFTTFPQMRLRGLCTNSAFDRQFSFRDNKNFKLVFDGVGHIVMRQENNTWVMRSRLYKEMTAVMVSQWRQEYPVGVHTWSIYGDKCRQKEVQLLLTSCRGDEYTCDDGTCIQKTRRCDLSVDCTDQSDEMNCSIAQIPSWYSASLPPPKLASQPVPIGFFLNVTSIKDFNLVSFTISIDASLELKWRDPRLKFTNLQTNSVANKIKDQSQVWTPVMAIRDATLSIVQVHDRSGAVFVEKTAGPLPDDDATIREDTVYSGGENTMTLQKEDTLTFKCYFDLQLYPFDRQSCSIVYNIQDITTEFGVLVQATPGVQFAGNRQLLEYILISEASINYTLNSVSHVQVNLFFRNQYGYYLANTFVPTIMLVIICWLTAFFDIADFQDRIMVSLTSLLVLATFFTQTSQSIPKTSYLKLIDVWFVVLISEDFAMIVALVYIEFLRLKPRQQEQTKGLTRVLPARGAVAWDARPGQQVKGRTVGDRANSSSQGKESNGMVWNDELSRQVPSSHVPGNLRDPVGRIGYYNQAFINPRATKANTMFLRVFTVNLAILLLCFGAMCLFSAFSR
nr:uncharacterized protein LOC123771045 [Procambarus clarkii]